MLANSITAFAQLAVLAAVARAAHHEVAVGKDKQLKFVPETLNAAIGDTITYSFFAKVIGNVRGGPKSSLTSLACRITP